MGEISLQNIGLLVRTTRGDRGIRETANDIEISAATLSRIENGKLPDLETFSKICRWLKIDPNRILNCTPQKKSSSAATNKVGFHLKAKKNLDPNTAKALANMILSAQNLFDE